MKTLIRRWVGGWVPQYVPVAVEPDALPVRATLRTATGEHDVTRGCSIAALSPLLVAVAQPDAAPRAQLEFHDRDGARLGELELVYDRTLSLGLPLQLYRVTGYRNRCASRRRLGLQGVRHVLQRLGRARRAFDLSWQELGPVLVFYTQPRPVFVVTVDRPDGAVMFPMDLIGELPGDRMLLALRHTNAHLGAMAPPSRIVLSEVPLAFTDAAYGLARFHRQPLGGAALDFDTLPSPRWGLPVPALALRVRELSCVDMARVGSHHLFVCQVEQVTTRAAGPRLCHVQGFYDRRARARS